MTASPCAIAVLTESAAPYRAALGAFAFTPEYFTTIEDLMEALRSSDRIHGLILDISLVMRAHPKQRDLLFFFAERLPFLRSRLDKETGVVLFADPVERFLDHCQARQPLHFRAGVRAPVRFNAELAPQSDPSMSNPSRVNVLDISLEGCLIYTLDNAAFPDSVYLRILELADRTPILCDVRWRRGWGRPFALPGMGVSFVTVSDAQLAEIRQGYVAPYEALLREKS